MPSLSARIPALAAAGVLVAGAGFGAASAAAKSDAHTKQHQVKKANKKHHAKAHKKAHKASRERYRFFTNANKKKTTTTPAKTTTTTKTTTPPATTTTTKTTTPPATTTTTKTTTTPPPTTTTTTPPATTTTTKTTTTTTPPPTTTTTTPPPTTTTTTPPSTTPVPVGVSGNWTMAFDDEFNGSSVNTSAWTTHDGWANQNNVTDHASNIVVANGDATMSLASSTSGAALATTAATLKVGGYAEARIDFAGSGTKIYNWPAFWASGPSWPAAGENDIAEGLGTLTVNYHSPSGAHNQGTIAGTWSNGFHTYGIYRGSNYCNVYWDGKLVKTYSTDDNGQPQTVLLTEGSGNTLSIGAAGQMVVDYVRVWS